MVTDYRRLNSLTIKDNHPIPKIQDQLISLRGQKYFSTIDLNSGYYQICMEPEDIHKTSFSLPFGQFEYIRMPFGLTNAPRTFQRAMTKLLGHLDFIRIYLDDILVIGKTREEHLENIEKTFIK